ncbi:MAG: GerAB/ArcD/ProY family transporter [Bacillota bacterium]|nr:GerAB/ArcD/ProY family transporter [Bacillota bacterium]
MEKSKALTRSQWAALAAMSWLAPLARIAETNGEMAAGKILILLPALLFALLGGLLLLRIAALSSFFDRLRDSFDFKYQLARGLLAVYLLLICGHLLSDISALWCVWAAAESSSWLFTLLLLAILVYGLHRGSSAVMRWAVLALAALPILAVLDTLLLLPKMRWERLFLLPAQDLNWSGGFFNYLLLLLSGLPVLLWYGALPNSRSVGAASLGWLVSGLYLLLLVIRDSLLQGLLSTWERFPLLRSLKMVELGVGLNRMEFLAILVLMGLMLAGVMLLAAASREMLERISIVKREGSIIFSIIILAAAAFL